MPLFALPIDEARRLATDGWNSTVQRYCSDLQSESGTRIRFAYQSNPDDLLPFGATLRLYEFVRIALRTLIEHLRARTMSVNVWPSGKGLALSITHDGKKSAAAHLGTVGREQLHIIAAELGSVFACSANSLNTQWLLSVALPSCAAQTPLQTQAELNVAREARQAP